MNLPHAVLFDLDDTLIDRNAMMELFAPRFLHHFFPDADGNDYAHLYETFIRVDNSGFSSRPDIFYQLYQELGRKTEPPADEMYAFWNGHYADTVVAIPKMERVLHALRESGHLLGLITNGNALNQNRKIDNSGIRPLFDHILVSGMFTCDKPDPRIFQAALRALGVTAREAVYVGDNPINDISGAHSAGMRAVLADYFGRWNQTQYHPDAEIHTLPELLEVNLPEPA